MNTLYDKIELVKDLPKELMEKMRRTLVPVVDYDKKRSEGYTFKNRENIPISDIAYTWIEDGDKNFPRVKLNGKLFAQDATPIISFHSWGYYGFFKPSLGEVYSAIYSALGGKWGLVGYFWLDNEDMGSEHIISNFQYCKLWLWETAALSSVDSQGYIHPIGLKV